MKTKGKSTGQDKQCKEDDGDDKGEDGEAQLLPLLHQVCHHLDN